MTNRFAVDLGGTFSDLIYYDDETGAIGVGKMSSTPDAPDRAVLDVVRASMPQDALTVSRYFLHGSTVALNALLQRAGATVGVLTTKGFRDVLELRRGDRESMNDLRWSPPPPLVPRRLRREVRERMRVDGTVETPLDLTDVTAALDAFGEDGVDCIAVVLLHAYANPDHELAVEDELRARGFEGAISLSHQLSGEFREYERTTTTVIDAYVRPLMSEYLRRLDANLADAGFGGTSLASTSGGGALTFPEAEARPCQTIMSGPAAGAVGAGRLCRSLGIARAVSADVGGTSFDACLIVDGAPEIKHRGRVAGLPLQSSWVDVRSIGAGGGSIAYVDAGGLMHVGPRSAGAQPGPACYGRGGTEPTVSDAAAVLGMLATGELAGSVRLDFAAAQAALAPLAAALGLEVDDTARGVLTIATAHMADAIREVTLEQGYDPRDAGLVCFGGAGPLFGTLMARELGIATIVVPNHAGNFSARGLLTQDLVQRTERTAILPLDAPGLASAQAVLDDLFATLDRRSSTDGADADAESAVDVRFAGQEHTLTVTVPLAERRFVLDAPAVRDSFIRSYRRTFGHAMDEAAEIVSVRAALRRELPDVPEVPPAGGGGESEIGKARAFSFTRGRWLTFPFVLRSGLAVGDVLPGPAIVLEPTTTTYVDAGFVARVDPSGTMLIADTEAEGL